MKIKTLIIAALVAAIFMPAIVFADEEPVETTEPVEETQPVENTLQLIVKVLNLADDDAVIEELSAIYELKNALGIPDAVKVHEKKVIEDGKYKIAEDALGRRWIEIDVEACEARIYVYPAKQDIQIIHHLCDCTGKVVRRFLEAGQIDFLADLNDEVAAEIAKTRIQQMNAKGFIFKEAKVEVGSDLPPGVTVKTLDGEDVTPDAKLPTVHLLYVESGCLEENPDKTEPEVEEKVDAANADYSSQQTLPATGEQDLVTFLLSASALLGLGIFFARKH